MNYWDSAGRWINTALLVVVGSIGFDTLFRLLEANPDNAVVGLVGFLANIFLAPFASMFGEQDFLLTALIAVLGYALLAGVMLAVTRSIQATRALFASQGAVRRPAGSARPVAAARTPTRRQEAQPDRTRRLPSSTDATRPAKNTLPRTTGNAQTRPQQRDATRPQQRDTTRPQQRDTTRSQQRDTQNQNHAKTAKTHVQEQPPKGAKTERLPSSTDDTKDNKPKDESREVS